MRILFLFITALPFLFSACQQSKKRQTTEGGYEYIMHTGGAETAAQPGDFMFFHLQIRNGDSVVYRTREESLDPPVIPYEVQQAQGRTPYPFEPVLQQMGVGDSATVFVPIDSFPQKPTGFEGAQELIYDIVLVDLKDEAAFQTFQQEKQAEAQARMAEVQGVVQQYQQQYVNNELDGQLQTSESGLKYIIIEQGSGSQPGAGDRVSVNYYGALAADGADFDNSFMRGQPYMFPFGQGQSIPGFEEGIGLLNEGGKAVLFIPAELGYGEAGSPPAIPGGAELLFYVQLEDVQSATQQ